ncbi:hypothetical protein BSL82_11840 [Tardibacter chloracetimidivorans]|uniref:Acyl-CoA dehydrogenase n=1 Tax=Tardibacter chloracetimidivorans TaxID=1921510 RepID=A0A1L3ZWA6_9SPHN|nr:acyl-CoA dehydrogenase family protein [Tardibacter chloracetimidivorans]API59916.1 hypothetical protein BSL82_11840 [Tardibacter chloracetimidivorans]
MTDDDDIGEMLRDSAASFIQARFDPHSLRGEIDGVRAIDRALWSEMAKLGWLAVLLPEAMGGLGASLRAANILAEIFGRAAFQQPFVAAAVIPSTLLAQCQGAAASKIATELLSGETVVTLAWQSAADDFDPRFDGAELGSGGLSGAKRFVPAVEEEGRLIVSATRNGEPVLVAVDAAAPAVRISRHRSTLIGLADVEFHGVTEFVVLAEGKAARTALSRAIEAGRVALAAQASGLLAGALDRTIAHVSQRVQFDKPIGSFQSVQHRCVDQHIALQIASASVANAASCYDSDPELAETLAAISSAKARACDAALAAGTLGVQLHGAMGFTEEAEIGHYLRAAMASAAWLGSSPAHRRRFISHRAPRESVHG